jgi:hypothetical protein
VSEQEEQLTAEQFARWWRETGERELRQILFWQWDPIGISWYFPTTADEYDGYTSGVVLLLRSGASEEELADHLRFVEREAMGLLRDDADHRAEVAQMLAAWFLRSLGSWREHGPL